ncbi:hypothetical protein SacmaDRAFT_4254 [Saccharomonospora marina XMU15]|uniref:Uncharacterized protein n=1 Tax=Saccharomonospora marina XMU15 TaxID=882083 RepID=H5X7U4_9PSEU|nr:hypothetical protein [Saccharomonospora marina]EHR52444.1 hypothetical protein SacmaDRAFT_4254 [Saccharomonospora marina XMU15]
MVYIHHWAYDAGTVEVFEVFDTFAAARAKFTRDRRIRDVEWDIAEENLRAFPRPERLDI